MIDFVIMHQELKIVKFC